MSQVIVNDLTHAAQPINAVKGVQMVRMESFKVERVFNLDEFKSKKIDFSSLKPAILMNQSVLVMGGRAKQ